MKVNTFVFIPQEFLLTYFGSVGSKCLRAHQANASTAAGYDADISGDIEQLRSVEVVCGGHVVSFLAVW